VRWFQALAVLAFYCWLMLGAFMVAFILTHGPAEGAELRAGELSLIARVVAAESTGEPLEGARAIVWTVVNRLEEPEVYGRTITAVLTKPAQYAAPARYPDNSLPYVKAMLATVQVLLRAVPDNTAGATHFARCDVRPKPAWMRTFRMMVRIASHCFFSKKP